MLMLFPYNTGNIQKRWFVCGSPYSNITRMQHRRTMPIPEDQTGRIRFITYILHIGDHPGKLTKQ